MSPIHVVEVNPWAPQPHAFTDTAVCLRDALRAAGHASEHLVNTVPAEGRCIVVGGSLALPHQVAGLDRRRCAIFNLEPLGNAALLGGPDYRQWLADWLVLDAHDANIALLRRENGKRQQAFALPLVPSMALQAGPAVDKRTDVLLDGALTDRRRAVVRQLQAMGYTVEAPGDIHGPEQAAAIARARLVLHVHAQPPAQVEALFPVARLLRPVAMGVPVVCETAVVSPLNDWSDAGLVVAGYAELGEACAGLLESEDALRAHAGRALAFAAGIDITAPLAPVLQAWQAREAAPAQDVAPSADPLLSNAEIEAILAAEAAQPEAAQPPAELHLVRHEPGQGRLGPWMAWLLAAFILFGAISAAWPR